MLTYILSPPFHQLAIALSCRGGWPIELWIDIVHIATFHPFYRVTSLLFVVIQTCDTAWQRDTISACYSRFQCPNTECTHTETYPRLGGLNTIVEILHHLIHVATAPIIISGAVFILIHNTCRWFVQRLRLRILGGSSAIWIEIVIHQDTVHIVVLYDLHQHVQHILACLWVTWVNDLTRERTVVILDNPITCILPNLVRGGDFTIACYTEWVYPYVQLHTTFVCLLNGKCQWVVAWVLTTATH